MAQSAIDRATKDFEEKLELWVEKIKTAANGKTCGTCEFFVSGLCLEQDILIERNSATACSSHKRRRNQ